VIEIRWKQTTGTTSDPPVLQYRVQRSQVTSTGYSGHLTYSWSDWMDVPVVNENIQPSSIGAD